ncbi:transmembrane protein, putative (macronuclear) [Tetrahymena thermophila SB210]|uniref:Transmembrane protein, putative n=1 Tax=Tetrahymena thermophila (strain SB210) TaxID=312017 RepID=W7XH50_TETTS|nr:transmembrane protein, putative [Tetrahymena thermophila SB210]EWS73656.1 transmembrane protein, putative [Tetrahymena thermophila SB210]|eukprot:XP_012653786.1 transmembrane protein, putative [Tetrahymena thermophila SB210]
MLYLSFQSSITFYLAKKRSLKQEKSKKKQGFLVLFMLNLYRISLQLRQMYIIFSSQNIRKFSSYNLMFSVVIEIYSLGFFYRGNYEDILKIVCKLQINNAIQFIEKINCCCQTYVKKFHFFLNRIQFQYDFSILLLFLFQNGISIFSSSLFTDQLGNQQLMTLKLYAISTFLFLTFIKMLYLFSNSSFAFYCSFFWFSKQTFSSSILFFLYQFVISISLVYIYIICLNSSQSQISSLISHNFFWQILIRSIAFKLTKSQNLSLAKFFNSSECSSINFF